MRITRGFAIGPLAAAAVLACVGAGLAQDHTPPSWDTLVRCANMTDSDEELACYRAAMKAAGFVPNQAVREAEKRRVFGLALPSIRLGHHKTEEAAAPQAAAPAPGAAPSQAQAPAPAPAPEEDEDVVTVELAEVAVIPPANKLLLITTDGAVWKQTDDESVRPFPRPGQKIEIHRTSFGGYFCKFDRTTKVRCIRSR